MNFSLPFIERPIATTLLSIGVFLVGAVAYDFLPVAALPGIEYPTIHVSASRPGADPSTMAATVAAPLERRLGEIPGVIALTSTSSLGTVSISVQFDIGRRIDNAARDVQAALNAAVSDLPGDLPNLPNFRKANPNATPILILALTSDTRSASAIYDIADTVIAQRLSQVDGVAQVSVSGAEQPAIRIRVNPVAIASMGINLEDVRLAIVNANAAGPLGAFDSDGVGWTIGANAQMRDPREYRDIVVKSANGAVTLLGSIASIELSTRNSRSAAWFNRQPAVLLVVTKQAEANVIETIDRIMALLPELKRWAPADLRFSVLSDRTQMIRASVRDMQLTLGATVLLVMLVVFIFLRRPTPTIAVGVTVPLSLAGTCAAMWLAGYSIDNLSLMALAVSVGFVVDDAIVMIENAFRNLEKGYAPVRAAIEGASQIGFTVISISISLVAAFIPLLFMGGLAGRLFREFSVTLVFAIAISTLVSLSVTPMICAHWVRAAPSADATRFDRLVEGVLARMMRGYSRSLAVVLRHRVLTLLALAATIALTVNLYMNTPKGFFPQDDSGFVGGVSVASSDISFSSMVELHRRASDIVLADPAVAGVGASVGGSSWSGTVNNGIMFIALKPRSERGGLSTLAVVERMRLNLQDIPGARVYMWPAQQLPNVGGRQSRSQYQFTLVDADAEELATWVPRVQDRIGRIPGIIDVTTDQEQGGLQANVVIDRTAASRLGVQVQDIDNALNNSFSQRQISTVFTQRNQYRVIMEVDAQHQRDPSDLDQIYVAGAGGIQVPLSAVTRLTKSTTPLAVNHQGQYPAVTITYNLDANTALQTAADAVLKAVAEMHLPDTLRSDFAGDMKVFTESAASEELLILAALIGIYIVLGVLYESLAHPLTIISTLPSAGLGALLALTAFGAELSIIAFIGIILLIGIVKKNGIMLVDFAIEGERRGLSADEAIHRACVQRFRPILMTTLSALLGALPLLVATGTGAELRRPLGMTIIGGLVVSQILTLYTTPVIYLLLDRLHRRLWGTPRQIKPGWRTVDVPAE
ncbi:MAG TPA: efflux RND transporter permease subunit [Xanthobacteraceae bacterium]|nr:efflux RND transporter permease subunit [Xanthobacteraceae bacterium]